MMLLSLFACLGSGLAFAEGDNDAQWSGEKVLVPVSAPDMVLEAVDSGTAEGTVVSINFATGAANQKWVFTAKGQGQYSIHPSYSSDLALTAEGGGTENGTRLVLAADKGLDFNVKFDGKLPETNRTDEKRLQQIVLNLLSNAFKFTSKGSVTLGVRCADKGWSASHPVLSSARRAIEITVKLPK
jgi:signal transduction histidine kinase